jgi:antirestriction protein ArdC
MIFWVPSIGGLGKGWPEKLKSDPSMLIKAGSEAQKAFDYIMDAKAAEQPAELQQAA